MEKNNDKHCYATYPLRVYCSDAWDALLDFSKRVGSPMNKLLNDILRDYIYEYLSYQTCYTIEERKAFHNEFLKRNFFAEFKEPAGQQITKTFLLAVKQSLFILDAKTNDLFKWLIQLLSRNSTTDYQRQYIDRANDIIKIYYKDINELWKFFNKTIEPESE